MSKNKIAYRLRHQSETGDFTESFYDGELQVKDGVIEIPSNKPHWLSAAWLAGFRCNPDTGKQYGELLMVPSEDQKKMANLRAAKEAKAAAERAAAEEAERLAAEQAADQNDKDPEPSEETSESEEPEVTDGGQDSEEAQD